MVATFYIKGEERAKVIANITTIHSVTKRNEKKKFIHAWEITTADNEGEEEITLDKSTYELLYCVE